MFSNLKYPNYFDEYVENFTKTLTGEVSSLHSSIYEESKFIFFRTSLLTTHLEHPIMDLNIQNRNYETPLLASLRIRNKKLSTIFATKLLQAGADINIPDYHGDLPLHEIVKFENYLAGSQILDLLLNNPECNVNARNSFGETPLHVAVTEFAIKKLLEKGANVNGKDNNSNTPLHKQVKNVEICKLLIENGAIVNMRNKNGYTPLHESLVQNVEETVILLLEHGADVNIETDCRCRMTALQLAYIYGNSEKIKQTIWDLTKPEYLLFIQEYDKTKKTNILQEWLSYTSDPTEISKFIILLISLLYNLQQFWFSGASLVAEYFIKTSTKLDKQNFKKIVKNFSKYLGWSFLNFLLRIYDYTQSVEEIEVVVNTFIKHGEFIDYTDLEVLYVTLGDSELIHNLLRFRIIERTKKLKDLSCFLNILCDTSTDLTKFINSKTVSSIEVLDFVSVYCLARYCTFTKRLHQHLCETYNNLIRFENSALRSKDLEEELKKIGNNCGLSSLLELSRNATRSALCRRYKIRKAFDLYRILKKLKLPPMIIEIIMLEFPLFDHIQPLNFLIFKNHLRL